MEKAETKRSKTYWVVDRSWQYPGKSIRASRQKHLSGQTLSQPFLADHEMSIQAERSIQAGLSWQKIVSRHPDIFAGIHFLRDCSFCAYVKSAFHVFLNNPISYATSGQTVMWKMTVHWSSCYELFIKIMTLAYVFPRCIFFMRIQLVHEQ